MDKIKDYAANVWYLMRVKPAECSGLIVIGFLIGFVL